MKVSIIIVNYHVQKELLACIASIYATFSRISFEIVVVDNDEKKTIEKRLHEKFPKVVYIPSATNVGFGEGNNLGAAKAKGEYLFFLNPDTLVQKNCLEKLLVVFKTKKNAGIVAPLLLDPTGKPYTLQGTQQLTPLRAIFSLSFLQKIFPKSPISQEYWYQQWDKKTLKAVDVIPGSAFMISTKLFTSIGQFDESFFLFFEENDLCMRVQKKEKRIYFQPEAQVVHLWGKSTEQIKTSAKIFKKSRFLYFKKNFGLLSALLTEVFLRIKKEYVLLTTLLIIGLFLRLDRIQSLMPLIGDQGWFYLSAHTMLRGTIPLVGITSSHTWLHQGPLWTYLLAVIFAFTKGDPVAPAYFTGIVGVATTYFLYIFGKQMFSQRVGFITAALFAVSPLVVIYTRMPYHTTLIPLVTLLFIYAVYKVTKGNKVYLPISTFLLGIAYNFELATLTLFFVLFSIIFLGLWQKQLWAKKLFGIKIILISLVTFSLPMIPIYLYDVTHGFPQTLWVIIWVGYSILKPLLHFLGYTTNSAELSPEFGYFLQLMSKRLVFAPSALISIGLILVSSVWIVIQSFTRLRQKTIDSYSIVLLTLIATMGALVVSKTISEAYLPSIFIPLFFTLALFFDSLLGYKNMKLFIYSFFGIIISVNVYTVYTVDYYATEKKLSEGFVYTLDISSIEQAADAVINVANNKEFTIKGGGAFRTFASSIDNYKYVLLWKGAHLKKNTDIVYFIYPSNYHGTVLEHVIYTDHAVTIVTK